LPGSGNTNIARNNEETNEMAAKSITELRRIRTAATDDPELVVSLAGPILTKGGYSSAGDECP